MCSKTKCNKCHKISFIGCGRHLLNIFNGLSKNDLCLCNPIIIKFIKDNKL